MCLKRLCVKWLRCKERQLPRLCPFPPHHVFQHLSLHFFGLMAHDVTVHSRSRQLFLSGNVLLKPLRATCSAPNIRQLVSAVGHRAAVKSDIPCQLRWRQRTEWFLDWDVSWIKMLFVISSTCNQELIGSRFNHCLEYEHDVICNAT